MNNCFKPPSLIIKLPPPTISLNQQLIEDGASNGNGNGNHSEQRTIQENLFDRIEHSPIVCAIDNILKQHPILELHFLRGLYQVLDLNYDNALQGLLFGEQKKCVCVCVYVCVWFDIFHHHLFTLFTDFERILELNEKFQFPDKLLDFLTRIQEDSMVGERMKRAVTLYEHTKRSKSKQSPSLPSNSAKLTRGSSLTALVNSHSPSMTREQSSKSSVINGISGDQNVLSTVTSNGSNSSPTTSPGTSPPSSSSTFIAATVANSSKSNNSPNLNDVTKSVGVSSTSTSTQVNGNSSVNLNTSITSTQQSKTGNFTGNHSNSNRSNNLLAFGNTSMLSVMKSTGGGAAQSTSTTTSSPMKKSSTSPSFLTNAPIYVSKSSATTSSSTSTSVIPRTS
jgi:hypothetical protein